MEAHAFGQYKSNSGLVLVGGAGTGLVAGLGAPDIRLFGLISYAWEGIPPVYDRDHDGIIDERDKCPDNPEDLDSFQDEDGCPDLDNDGDGLPDVQDQCPLQAEDFDTFRDEDGCPDPDNDGDRVLDIEDACPLEPGPIESKGCPDRDGDGIRDLDDACPDEPGPLVTKGCPDRDGDRVPDFRDKCPDQAADPRIVPELSDGCPSRVFVSQEKVVIMEKVFFDTNKATIKKQSFGLLDDVAKVLNENKQIKRLEIQGHTDDVGKDATNLTLSQKRAEAVMTYLVTKGKVDPNRLESKGYGESRPTVPNDGEKNRSENRRVEFVILEQ
jgi:outer membrane protein OmpA-like peptidoglycan-associated protein